MIKFYSLCEEDSLIFEANILIFEDGLLIFEESKTYIYLITNYLNLFPYIILLRGNLFLAARCWKEEISRYRVHSLTFSHKNSFLYHR